eukprot:SAG11_NODE_13357_length_658_cov_4.491950_1_plen_159_part_10
MTSDDDMPPEIDVKDFFVDRVSYNVLTSGKMMDKETTECIAFCDCDVDSGGWIFDQFVDDGAKIHSKNLERVYDAMIRKFVLGRVFKAMATLVEVEEETHQEKEFSFAFSSSSEEEPEPEEEQTLMSQLDAKLDELDRSFNPKKFNELLRAELSPDELS